MITWSSGVLEHDRDRPGEIGRPSVAGVDAANAHAPLEASAVKVRDEAGQGAHEGRFTSSGETEQRDRLALIDPYRDIVEGWPRATAVRHREPLGDS